MTTNLPPTTCANHPGVETNLRCNRCEKPICSKCAIKSPVGYRCPECVKSQQKIFDTALWYDYLTAFVAAVITSAVASILVMFISGFFFGLITLAFAPFAGQIIARVIRMFIKNRRSTNLFYTAAAGVVVGALPLLFNEIVGLFFGFQGGQFSVWGLLPAVWLVVYLALAVPSVYSQLSGIQLFK
jgi:hypothetical protein